MIKKTLLSLSNKNILISKAKKTYQAQRDAYYRSRPLDEKLIVFEAYRSSKYACSPKAIYEQVKNNPAYEDYRFIWLFEDPEKYRFLEDSRTSLVKHETHAYYMAFATAKYWVVNGWLPMRVQKKNDQIALQCWHGTPLKRLRHDIISSTKTEHYKNSLKENDIDMARYDFLLSPSRFATQVFTSAFNLHSIGKQDIVIETGYPRNDALIHPASKEINQLREKLNIPKDKKVLLYAPTWRDDQNIQNVGYNQRLGINFDILQQNLKKDYIILFRAHNLIDNSFDFEQYGGFVRDVSDYDDINHLYLVSNVLMTDYSSVFFDYANLGRPIIFFMYDQEHYQKYLRGFYLDLNTLPGEIVKQEGQVVNILGNLGAYTKKYQSIYEKFNKTYNYLDDGRATERAIEALLK